MSFFNPYHQFPRMQLIHWVLIGLVVIASIVASINPLEFDAYLLHQVGTVAGMIVLLILLYQRNISISGFALTIVFILLHILGAHYLYSFVPYNDWSIHYFNFDMNQYFGWSRNMYDRLIHFGYGLLLFKICCDVFSVWLPKLKPYQIALMSIQFIMASSMIYELIEWGISLTFSEADAENYNGQQGDIWDAQKDMALATLGAVIAWVMQIAYTVIKPK
jgi:putative membrane protein